MGRFTRSRALLLLAGVLLAATGAAAMSQYDSLVALKAAIDPKGDKVPWGPGYGDDVCKWKGIACDKQGKVYSAYVMRSRPDSQPWDISKAGEPLRGTLPSASVLAGLPKIDEFACFYCGLQGTLPADWGSIATLTAVTLTGWPAGTPGADKWPKVSGSFPESWLYVKEMKYVTITHQDLSGTLPASLGNAWPKVEDLMLEGNRLEGPLPWGVGKMPRLNRLTLNDNKFSGPIPSTWSYFRKLVQVDLSNNQISGNIPTFLGDGWQAVQYLHLRGNQLSGRVPWELNKMWSLYELDLSYNKLSGWLPTGWNQGRLQYFGASNNNLDGPLPADWKLGSLQTLDLAHNRLRGSLPQDWGWNLPSLQIVALGSNDLEGQVPGSWNKLNLQQLDIAYNGKMSGCLPKGKEWLGQKFPKALAGTSVKASC